jgi:hypothetical protein
MPIDDFEHEFVKHILTSGNEFRNLSYEVDVFADIGWGGHKCLMIVENEQHFDRAS